MISVVPYSLEHRMCFQEPRPGTFERIEQLVKTGLVFAATLMFGDRALAIVGGTPIYPQVYEVWSIMSPNIARHKFSLVRCIRSIMMIESEKRDIRRYQMYIDSARDDHVRFAEALKFEREGVLCEFGQKRQHFYVYGRVVR